MVPSLLSPVDSQDCSIQNVVPLGNIKVGEPNKAATSKKHPISGYSATITAAPSPLSRAVIGNPAPPNNCRLCLASWSLHSDHSMYPDSLLSVWFRTMPSHPTGSTTSSWITVSAQVRNRLAQNTNPGFHVPLSSRLAIPGCEGVHILGWLPLGGTSPTLWMGLQNEAFKMKPLKFKMKALKWRL